MNGQEFHSSRCCSLCTADSERRVDRSALIIHCLLRVKHTAYQFSNTFRSSLGRCYKSTLAPRTLPYKAIQFQFVCSDVFDLPLKQARFLPIFLSTVFPFSKTWSIRIAPYLSQSWKHTFFPVSVFWNVAKIVRMIDSLISIFDIGISYFYQNQIIKRIDENNQES